MTTYWQEHQVGGPYRTRSASEKALRQREIRYPDLYRYMPVTFPGMKILDYGCGPGHDTVLFLQNGAMRVYYLDVSWKAIVYTETRLDLYGFGDYAERVDAGDPLPLVDHFHCAGVLHHTEDPLGILEDLHTCLKPKGDGRVMVYDGDASEHSQSDVPITHWWSRDEFLEMCASAGFSASYMGSYPCSAEWRPNCYAACYYLH